MSELDDGINRLKSNIDKAFDTLSILRKEEELQEYEKEMADPEFWSDPEIAKEVSVKHSKLQGQIGPWLQLARDLQELTELRSMGDGAMNKELKTTLKKLEKTYDELEFDLKFSGEYDSRDALVTIQAGAGGTDAQDWVQILQRMYFRWAESHKGIKAELLHEASGDEAGLKNTTFSLSGPYAFGKLRSEHGVHRLVRLSPFNTAHSRETSFAFVEVVPRISEPGEVELDEADLKIDVYRAGGRGGQSVNTTDSAVRITHEPTGIVVAIQNERSQTQNKETALSILRSKLARLASEQRAETIANIKGDNVEAAWGNQIRNYVMHPYTLVKDTRTGEETSDISSVLDGDIDRFINAYLTSAHV